MMAAYHVWCVSEMHYVSGSKYTRTSWNIELVDNLSYTITWGPDEAGREGGGAALDIVHFEKKKSWLASQLFTQYLSRKKQTDSRHVGYIYCVCTALSDGLARCGVFIQEYLSTECHENQTMSERMSDNTSSTVAELQSVCVRDTRWRKRRINIHILWLIRVYWEALGTTDPRYYYVVNICRGFAVVMQGMGYTEQFLWKLSHVVHLHELADELTKSWWQEFSLSLWMKNIGS